MPDLVYSIALPLMGGVAAPLLGLFVYRYVRRRLKVKEGTKSRAYLFYRVLSGVLLGQFVCHTSIQPDATLGYYYPFVFVLGGYLLMDTAESIGRVWNTNRGYIGPMDEHVDDDVALNKEQMQENTVVVTNNISSNDFAETVWTAEDVAKDKRKRLWMLGVLFLVFSFIAMTDGFLLTSKIAAGTGTMPATIAFLYVNGIAMTFAIYGGMIHAKLPLIEGERKRWGWTFGLGVTWCVVLVCSTIPYLVSTSPVLIADVLSSRAFSAFYGLSSGCVLRLQQYFLRKLENVDKKQTALGIVVFIVAAGQAAVTSLSL